jgi:hypothetical protein
MFWDKLGEDNISALEQILDVYRFPDDACAPCSIHGRDCPCYTAEREALGALKMVDAGTLCPDWSTMQAAHRRETGRSNIYLAVFGYERRYVKEHLIFHECTSLMNIEILDRLTGRMYLWWSIPRFCPSLFHFPATRNRRYTIGIRKDMMVMSVPWSVQSLDPLLKETIKKQQRATTI